MRVCVLGLWHLGAVTAACLAKLGFEVIGIDDDPELIANFQKGKAPLFEPGLDSLVSEGLTKGSLTFSTSFNDAFPSDFLWICYDTPVNELDEADTAFVRSRILKVLEQAPHGQAVIVSSQMPVESLRELEQATSHKFRWASSPENLRLGNALEVFLQPDRIVIGVRPGNKEVFAPLFERISPNLEWMGIESAEMTKHGINAFLAQSVSFANELAQLALKVGADPYEVARGLKSEKRIGKFAYLRPGPAFSGGTLARDLTYLSEKATHYGLDSKIPRAAFDANNVHKTWLRNRLVECLGGKAQGKTVGILGLTYKPGTDTLRRSAALETARWLVAQGARIVAFDPRVKSIDADLKITLAESFQSCVEQSEILFLGTEHPEFQDLAKTHFQLLKTKALIDPGEFLGKDLQHRCFRGEVNHV